jgi:hypothetical protein
MVKYRKILFVLLFAGFSLSASSAKVEFPSDPFLIVEERQDNTMSVEVMINGTSRITMENVPATGYLEVYSILGVRVRSINLKTCVGGCSIDLPKGIYILKAGKVAQKIIVR